MVGVLVYSLIQRQVRQSLRPHQQAIPGNKGATAQPTAAVVFASVACVTQGSLALDGVEGCEVHGWQDHHRFICQALGLDECWDKSAAEQKNNLTGSRAP